MKLNRRKTQKPSPQLLRSSDRSSSSSQPISTIKGQVAVGPRVDVVDIITAIVVINMAEPCFVSFVIVLFNYM